MNKKLFGNLILLLTAFIWGTAFVAQVSGMEYIGPFTFSSSRCFLATIFLGILMCFVKDDKNTKLKDWIVGGFICGLFLFMGSSLQQFGLQYTTAGKTSFITSLYILIIPLLSYIIYRTKINLLTWFAVILGAVGLYLLAIPNLNSFTMNKGDFIVLIGSFFWGGHILAIDKFNKKIGVVKLSFGQFAITTLLTGIVAMFFEKETATINNIFISWKAIAYAGILSAGIAYTLQMEGQKYTTPVIASLILSLESVFGALAGFLFLNEILSLREFLGCIIVFIAIIIAQLPPEIFTKKYLKNSN